MFVDHVLTYMYIPDYSCTSVCLFVCWFVYATYLCFALRNFPCMFECTDLTITGKYVDVEITGST